MPLDPAAVGAESGPRRSSWDTDDCLLYALAVGAGVDELSLTTENTKGVSLQVLPTFAVVRGLDAGIFKRLGSFDWARLVHAEQGVSVHRPLPTRGAVLTTTRIVGMYDKGKAALVVTEAESVDESTGVPLFGTRAAYFIGGAGGWGGDRGPSSARVEPAGPPDHVVTYRTIPEQALLYRLCGDHNPLHSDPAFARRAGFDRPILHGLATYGFAGRALVHTVGGGDVARIGSVSARFAAPVLPGDELRVEIWRSGEAEATFRVLGNDDTEVLTNGVCSLNVDHDDGYPRTN